MKTMTYGTMPSFEEFEAAFNDVVTEGDVYTVNLNSTDYHKLGALCLDARGAFVGKGLTWDFAYTCDELYGLLQALVTIDHSDAFESREQFTQAAWAGDFASSILFTLGFEWV